MYKVKGMLLAIVLVTFLGGALAFKASKKYANEYCTTTVAEDICPQFCPTLIIGVGPGTQFDIKVCTTTPVDDAEPGNQCYVDGINANGPLNCDATGPIYITYR